MAVMLDTHVWAWWLSGDARIARRERDATLEALSFHTFMPRPILDESRIDSAAHEFLLKGRFGVAADPIRIDAKARA